MLSLNFRRERFIRKVLRGMGRQRVALILQPGDVWVVEYAIEDSPGTTEALQTCLLRGWVEVLHHAIPSGTLASDGSLLSDPAFKQRPVYRLTEAGWTHINRSQFWVQATFLVSLNGLVVTCIGIWISWKPVR